MLLLHRKAGDNVNVPEFCQIGDMKRLPALLYK